MRNDSDEWIKIHDKLNNKLLHIGAWYQDNELRRCLNEIVIKVNLYTFHDHGDVYQGSSLDKYRQYLGQEIREEIHNLEQKLLIAYLAHDN